MINLYFIQFINGITVTFNMKNHKIIIMDYRKKVWLTHNINMHLIKITLIIKYNLSNKSLMNVESYVFFFFRIHLTSDTIIKVV